MKKISKLMLMLLVCFTLTACGSNSKDLIGETNNNKEREEKETVKGMTPADSYGAYLDFKSDALEDLTDSIPEENFLLPLELLGFTMVDLTMIPVTFCGLDEVERSGLVFLYNNFTYDYKDNKCILTFEAENGKTRYETLYDSNRDSMQTKVFVDDNLTFINEYIKYQDGYAAQYYLNNEEKNTVYRTIFRDKYIMTGIYEDFTSEPDSIYNSSGNLGEDWLNQGSSWSKYDKGVFTSNK